MPKDPEYSKTLTYRPGVHNFACLHGTEYEHPLHGTHNHNVHCAVCCVSKVLMIPAILKPGPGSTMDIHIMSEDTASDHGCTMFECVDKDQKSLPDSQANTNGAFFLNVEADCNTGLTCPPYNNHKELNCGYVLNN